MVIVLVKEMLREFVGREGGMFVCGDDRRVAAFARHQVEILIGVGFLQPDLRETWALGASE
jgi:hypothetical protein